jgi:hypothetical protein
MSWTVDSPWEGDSFWTLETPNLQLGVRTAGDSAFWAIYSQGEEMVEMSFRRRELDEDTLWYAKQSAMAYLRMLANELELA